MHQGQNEPESGFPEDLLKGAPAIGVHIKETTRRTYYLLEKQYIPGFKIGSIWHSRKSRLNQHYGGDA